MASRQCEFCFKRILSRKGAYAKHIHSCSSQQQTTHDNSKDNRNRASNPLLSNFCTKTQLSDDEFNTNGFSDSFLEDDLTPTNHHMQRNQTSTVSQLTILSLLHLTVLVAEILGHGKIQQPLF